MRVFFFLGTLTLLLTPANAGPANQDLETLRALYEAGEFETALKQLPDICEQHPENVELFQLAARIAEDASDRDLALWYAWIALELAETQFSDPERIDPLRGRVAELDSVAPTLTDFMEKYQGYPQNLFEVGRAVARRGYTLNAVDLFTRCIGTQFEGRARQELAEIYADEDAISRLAESGVNVPPPPKPSQEIERIAELDAEHNTWENAYRVETKNYVILTDMGYEMSQSIAEAMEQMNNFYDRVFKPRKRLDKCEIRVYKSRDEYLEHEGNRTAAGFFVPSKNYVATYDQRTNGWPMSHLWSTLFHEASHQFTHEVTADLVPGWLNEGTASYFEGARLLPNNSVITNNIPVYRLANLGRYLQRGHPQLESVLRYHQPGSYDVTYYPFGWGLVYFMHNYEDEDGDRVYLKPYQKLLGAYRKTVRDDAFSVFEKYVIEAARHDLVESYADFESLWTRWMLKLRDMRFGGPQASGAWIAKARTQLEHRSKEAALESYRYAILVDPNDVVAFFEMADLYADLRQRDAAIYNYGNVLQLTSNRNNEQAVEGLDMNVAEVQAETLERMSRINRSLGDLARQSLYEMKTNALKIAEAYREGGLPRRGLKVLDDAISLLKGHRGLEEAREDLATHEGVEVRRWRRLNVGGDLKFWQSTGDWWQSDAGVECLSCGIAFTYYRPKLPRAYRVEATASWYDRDGAPLFGLIFGNDEISGMQILTIKDQKQIEITTLKEGEPTVDEVLMNARGVEQEIKLAVEIHGDRADFYVNGKMVGLTKFDRETFGRRVGLFVDALDYPLDGRQAEIEFVKLRAFY